MIFLMLDAGLRVGEVAQARPDWFMFGGMIAEKITIPATASKNKTERSIPISLRLHSALKLMSLYWQADLDNFPGKPCFTDQPKGKAITVRQIQRTIQTLGQKALGYKIHPHMLRHTFATRLMKIANASIVQQLLGHKHLTSTQIYCHPDAEDLKTAIDKLDTANGKEKP